MKYISFIILINFLVESSVLSQINNPIMNCKDCGLFSSPIGGLDLCLGQQKESVLKLFDSVSFYENEYDKKQMCYNVNKKVKLPNNKFSNIFGSLAFYNNTLVYFNLSMPYGRKYEYYNELMLILKKADTTQINKFIYDSENVICAEKNNNCYKTFTRKRSVKKNSDFEINFKYTQLIVE